MCTIYSFNHKSGPIQITQKSNRLSALQNGRYLLMRGLPKVAMDQVVKILESSYIQVIGGELQIHPRLLGGGKKTQSNKDISEDFLCPITQQIMFDPVVAADGETYEREAIETHLKKSDISPLHGEALEDNSLRPNRKVKRQISAFLDDNPDYKEDLYLPQVSITNVVKVIKAQDIEMLKTLLRQDKRLLGKHYTGLNLPEAVDTPDTPSPKDASATSSASSSTDDATTPTQVDDRNLPADQQSEPSGPVEKTTLLELACTINPEILGIVLQAYNQKPQLEPDLIIKIAENLGVEGEKVLLRACTQNPQTCLPLALDINSPTFLQAVLELGADPNDGTPSFLHQAAAKNDIDLKIIDLLIDHGADAKAVNDQGQRPAALAKQLGYRGISERIEQKRQEKKLKHLIEPLIRQQEKTNRILNATHQALLDMETKLRYQSAKKAIQDLRWEIGEELGIEQAGRSSIPKQALGVAAWEHLGDIGEEPPIPPSYLAFLNEPAPPALGLEEFGSTIGETHILVLIPATLNGEPLTLDRFNAFLKSHDAPKMPSWCSLSGPMATRRSYWALISKGCIKDSNNKTFSQQCELIRQLGNNYQVPSLIEMVFGMYLQHRAHKDNLYVSTRTRCKGTHGRYLASGILEGYELSLQAKDRVEDRVAASYIGIGVTWRR